MAGFFEMAKRKKLSESFRERAFPAAALMGAFSSFVASLFRPAPARSQSRRDAALVQIGIPVQSAAAPTKTSFPLEYSQVLVLGASTSAYPFHRSLSGIAVDSSDRIYALGDGEIRVFEPGGSLIWNWKVPDQALCLAVGGGERVYIGLPGRIEIYNPYGTRLGGFAVGEANRPANVTSIKIYGREILAADSTARYIRRCDANGSQIGAIGIRGKAQGFMLPNRSLDIDVDSKGVVRATDSGRHRVSSWTMDGTPVGYFGKFGLASPEDFVGCCNPVNLAIAPNGNIVTAEKVAARVKVYAPDGKLLALIGPEHFDLKCSHLHLAVDSRGLILVADPVSLMVKVFSVEGPGGSRKL